MFGKDAEAPPPLRPPQTEAELTQSSLSGAGDKLTGNGSVGGRVSGDKGSDSVAEARGEAPGLERGERPGGARTDSTSPRGQEGDRRLAEAPSRTGRDGFSFLLILECLEVRLGVSRGGGGQSGPHLSLSTATFRGAGVKTSTSSDMSIGGGTLGPQQRCHVTEVERTGPQCAR